MGDGIGEGRERRWNGDAGAAWGRGGGKESEWEREGGRELECVSLGVEAGNAADGGS